MTQAHTAGPWRIGNAGTAVFGPPNGKPSPKTIASELSRADARLIAAAPDLLAWLEKAEQMAKQQSNGGDDAPMASVWAWLAENARATINKAKGE
jgi:hypothetical protein